MVGIGYFRSWGRGKYSYYENTKRMKKSQGKNTKDIKKLFFHVMAVM